MSGLFIVKDLFRGIKEAEEEDNIDTRKALAKQKAHKKVVI